MMKNILKGRFKFAGLERQHDILVCSFGTLIASMFNLKIEFKRTGVKKGAFSHLFTKQSPDIFGITVQNLYSDEQNHHMEMGMKKKSFILYTISIMLAFFIITGDQAYAQTPGIITAWDPNQELYLSHYIIYRDTSPGTLVPLDTIPNTDSVYYDFSVQPGQIYYYKLTAADADYNESEPSIEVMAVADIINHVTDKGFKVIENFELKQNYPNPFNPTTTIEYKVPVGSYVVLKIYNVLGEEIKKIVDGYKEAGSHNVSWDGSDFSGRTVSSGVYFYQMIAGNFNEVRKSIFQK